MPPRLMRARAVSHYVRKMVNEFHSFFGAELQARQNTHRVMRVNKMGIMVKTAIPTGTGITRLVIPILSSGYSITMTKQASKTVFQTAEIVKPHTKYMTPKKIPRLKGYLRRKVTSSFIFDSDWNEPDPGNLPHMTGIGP
ncbi:hypothetical protein [Paenibacillus tyrfis]|uniref:hypothetical protein n=1 Tax=Paenibacillus tyrfis TaxID=1501230 RepID=UPI001269A6EC|nr:hypothetical protein [Paenibacillus tyrfis]